MSSSYDFENISPFFSIVKTGNALILRKKEKYLQNLKNFMRVQKEFIETISKKIVRSLIEKDLIIWEDTTDKLETIISGIITEDLMVEDLLNEEVKTLLESKTEEYERSMMDYGRVFQMVKSKLVRERGLIL